MGVRTDAVGFHRGRQRRNAGAVVMSLYRAVPALRSSVDVRVIDTAVNVNTSGVMDMTWPVSMTFGPMTMSLSTSEAIELGEAMIRAAHHYIAVSKANAESEAVQA